MKARAEVHDLDAARRLKQLVPLIRADIEAGEQAGLEHFRRAGQKLIEAKGLAGHGEWYAWLDENFHLSVRTATRYMQLAEVPKSDTRVRFTSLRSATTPTPAPRPAPPPLGYFTRVDGEVRPACDFNAEDSADVAEPGDSVEVIRHRIFMYHANESLRHAIENGLKDAAPEEITSEVLRAAKRAAKAWTDVVADLNSRAKE